MKKILVAFLFLCSSVYAGEKAEIKQAETKQPTITESKFHWVGKKLTGQHDGTVKLKSGEVLIEGDELKGGSFSIDLSTIQDDDIKDDKEKNEKLVSHLKSEDFFDVAKYPTADFKIKEVKKLPSGENTHEIVGDLTIRGVTKSIKVPAKISIKDGKAQAVGTMTIDRTLWNLKYGSGKFFKNLGDKVINDEFTIDFDISAK